MRAAVTLDRCRVEVCDVPPPDPAPGEVLVRVGAVGLCGTDLHMWAGERAGVGFPLRQGHEIGAVVTELPADGSATHLAVGDVVAVDPSVPCGSCRVCRRGEWPSCAAFTAYGVARPGGLTELMAVPGDYLHRVPGVAPDVAALVEPVSVAAMALHRSGARAGDRVVVLGAGPIGMGLVLCARVHGVGVLVTDVLPGRLELARALGADVVVDVSTAAPAGAVQEWTGGAGADAAIEASGSPRALDDAVGLVGRGGTVVVVGLGDGELRVPVPRLLFEGVRVTGSRAGLFPQAVDVVSRLPAETARMISHRFPLTDVAAAFAQAHDDPAGTAKVLVEVSPAGTLCRPAHPEPGPLEEGPS
ncbi:zinc-dependent alcohol dehydrogenase [Geodermatophilus sp. CPCC 206100]|uniref:zinc-dependent alcohol dehydrogenase n=1 Tax=Geodermatophilus sp. CPCC 206100 TaxID=3020054 RepID=UPI003B00AE91